MKRAQIQKNKKDLKPSKFLGVPAAILTVATFTAAISGTFAWFNYSTRAYVKYEGVSAGFTERLNGGLRSSHYDEDVAKLFGSVETRDDGTYIYWAENQKITPEMLNGVIKLEGSATNTINPVTSGSYEDGNLTLYGAPRTLYNNISSSNLAKKEQYVSISFVFRVEDLEASEAGHYLSDKPIYLTEANLQCETNIYKSVRMFANNGSDQNLIHPGQKTDGSTKVGGTLNLNSDHDYDTFEDEETGEIREFAYGEFNKIEYKDETNPGSEDVKPEDVTTFLANHRGGSHSLTDDCKPKEALYKGMSNFRKGKTPITVTNGADNYANLDLIVFSEGWDLSVIEEENGNPFNLGLKFEIVF